MTQILLTFYVLLYYEVRVVKFLQLNMTSDLARWLTMF